MKKKHDKKTATANIMTTKKKRIDCANWKRNRKKEISTNNKCRIIEKNQKSYKEKQKWNDKIEITF